MTREEWLQRRRSGIGASDAAAVLGLSPYASPLSLFYEKTAGASIEEDDEVKEWGLLLEPAIATKYQKVTGRAVYSLGEYEIITMPGKPEFFCTPDRVVIVENERRPLQLKTSAFFDPKEELPTHWLCQEQHEMMVMASNGASFAILVAGRRFYHADVSRNDNFIAFMREKLEEFWYLVQRGTPPDPDGHAATTEALKRMFPKDRGTVVHLPAEASTWADELASVKEQAKILEQRQAYLENQLRAAIADNTYGLLEDGTAFSLKTTKRAGYTVEPTEYRSLRRVEKLPRGLIA